MDGFDYEDALDSINKINLDLFPNLYDDGNHEIPVGSPYPDIENCNNEQKRVMPLLLILIMYFGLVGNIIVSFVILVMKEYQKCISNWYVLHLVIANTIFLLMLPLTALEEMVGKWEYSTALCKAKEGILMVNYYASILFLTILSFDRYMAVTNTCISPWVDALRRLKFAIPISLIVWIISIALAVPIYLYGHVNACNNCAYDFPRRNIEICEQAGINETECTSWITMENSDSLEEGFDITREDIEEMIKLLQNFTLNADPLNLTSTYINPSSPLNYRLWLYLNFSLLFVLPFLVICIFYGLILRAMMGTAATASTNQRRYRRRVTLMVLALVTWFAISWLPWYVVKLGMISGFSLSADGCGHLANFLTVMAYLNSALNPYLYALLTMRFRKQLSSAILRSVRFWLSLFEYICIKEENHTSRGHDSMNTR